MKVVSGIYKGRNLIGFDLVGTRPTMDRVKESLFAMIQEYLDSAICLDLFSGSGSLGIEALSEGASKAYFVDLNPKACQVIRRNLETLKVENGEVFCGDYKRALFRFKNEKIKFDLIFLDPPYQSSLLEKSIQLIEEYDLLKDNGLLICESDSPDKVIYSEKFSSIKTRKYGDKWVEILRQI